MPYTYKGNVIGDTKTRGIIAKYDSEGSDMKLLEYGQFLHRAGGAPFVTKDINTGEPVERDKWFKMYMDTSEMAVQRRIDDTKRITKFIASAKGILWESEMAGLETIQQNYTRKQQERINKVRSGNTEDSANFWQKLGKNALGTLASLGKSVVRGVGLTASTLSQVAASGTGYHADTYISRAYLKDGNGIGGKAGSLLNELISSTGVVNMGNLNAAAKVLGGAQNVGGHPDPDKLLVPEEEATDGRHEADPMYGTQAAGRTSPKNYRGQTLGSDNYDSFGLHGVTKGGTSTARRGPLSEIRTTDIKDLGEKYGTVRDRDEELNSFKGNDDATSVAKYYGENEKNRYLKDTSIGVGKDEPVPYRVNTNLDTGSVKILYDTEEPKEYAKGQTPEGSFERKDKDNNVVTVQLNRKEELRVGLSKDGSQWSRDQIYTLIYNKKEPPVKTLAGDLKFNDSELAKDLGLIPFCITTITPDHRTYLNFPAYLDSYDDNYDGEWDSVRYIGRAENFYGYKGFKRSISLAFKVIANNVNQLEPLYRKLNRLVGATAPSYDSNEIFMRGTLASLTIGGWHEGALLKEQLGFIPNVKLSWESDVPWEINSQDDLTYNGTIKFVVPHALNVSMTFTPIEREEVREDYGSYFVFEQKNKEVQTEEPESQPVDAEPVVVTPVRKQLPEPDQLQPQRDNTNLWWGRGNIRGGGGLSPEQMAAAAGGPVE